MDTDDRLIDLLLRWEADTARGNPPTPEALCRECPELVPELPELSQVRLKSLRMERLSFRRVMSTTTESCVRERPAARENARSILYQRRIFEAFSSTIRLREHSS